MELLAAARPEAEDVPDAGTPEARATQGWRLGNPYWTGAADRSSTGCTAGSTGCARTSSTARRCAFRCAASRWRVHRRSLARDWGANEAIRRAPPCYAQSVQFAIVHHTAGTNSYTASQSAAIVRGIEVYHVKGNGWNDIGYNFLVDKYGQVFEGRYGGIDKPVIGAHAEGFNTGSVGVAVLGNYGSTAPPAAARTRSANLLAWRLDVAHVDPLVDDDRDLGRQPEVRCRRAGRPACRLGTSRHRLHDVSGRCALRPARRDRAAGRGDGSAEAVHADRSRRRSAARFASALGSRRRSRGP